MGKNKKKPKKPKGRSKLKAKTADRHELYQRSVQDPEHEVALATRYFKSRVGRTPLRLREDFCGTAWLCAEWVKSKSNRVATGVDFSAEVLDWGREHNMRPLGADASRVRLLEQDVRADDGERHEVIMALNYSYFVFKTRTELRSYFESVKRSLDDDGLFFLDIFGGWESVQTIKEESKKDGFRYVWHQAEFDPLTHDFVAHIHFRFQDGSRIKKAFTYRWRLWTIPEITEILQEAGFGHVEVLWENEDSEGEGTGVFRSRKNVTNDPGFNAYLMASVRTPPKGASKKSLLPPPVTEQDPPSDTSHA